MLIYSNNLMNSSLSIQLKIWSILLRFQVLQPQVLHKILKITYNNYAKKVRIKLKKKDNDFEIIFIIIFFPRFLYFLLFFFFEVKKLISNEFI